jgi:hypothetical protein
MTNWNDVYSSVAEANRQRGGRTITMRHACRCGGNEWRARNGVDPKYASEYNPGEYVEFTCTQCGYSFEEQS